MAKFQIYQSFTSRLCWIEIPGGGTEREKYDKRHKKRNQRETPVRDAAGGISSGGTVPPPEGTAARKVSKVTEYRKFDNPEQGT